MKLTLFLALAASARAGFSSLFSPCRLLTQSVHTKVLVDAAQMSRHRHGLLKARQGTVTDTNACTTDTDCASGCCGFTKAVCEGPCVALQRDGCGHGDAGSNSNAASQLGECSSLVAAYTPSSLAGAPGASRNTPNQKPMYLLPGFVSSRHRDFGCDVRLGVRSRSCRHAREHDG